MPLPPAPSPSVGFPRARRCGAALLLALCVGCGGAAPPAGPDGGLPSAAEAGLSGSVMQYRSDIARRVITIRVRAGGPLGVRDVVLRPAGFDAGEPAPVDAQLAPGTTVDLKATYGPARCDGSTTGATDAVVEVQQDGAARRVRLDLEDRYGLFTSLHRAECAERTIRRQVEFSFVGGWSPSPDGAAQRSTLRLRRLEGRAAVTVSELGGTTLFGLRAGPPGGPVAVLGPDAPEVSVPAEVQATRCDDHALAESKRATAFSMLVSVDGGVLVKLVLDPDQAGHDTLVRFASESCAARR